MCRLSILLQIIRKNLEAVQARVAAACDRVRRSDNDIELVAVTKYAEWEWVQHLAQLHRRFGENRPQQLAERQPQIQDASWHLIGQLQRNKCRQAVLHADVIHSVDSLRLLERVRRVALEEQQTVQLLIQVNVSGEESKSGFEPAELVQAWDTIAEQSTPCAPIIGLMTMAPRTDGPEATRPFFRQLRELRDQLNEQQPQTPLTDLSMGMSGDFEVAVEEGATLIRVGSALFQGLEAVS